MSFFINREESIIMSRAVKQYIRALEKQLAEARKEKDEKKEALIKKRILQGTRLIKKAGKCLEASSNLYDIVDEDFRA